MKKEKEIKEYSDRWKKMITNKHAYYFGFSPSSYDDITNKFREIESKYSMINLIESKSEDELNNMLEERRKEYSSLPKDNNRIFELRGEIDAIKWILE